MLDAAQGINVAAVAAIQSADSVHRARGFGSAVGLTYLAGGGGPPAASLASGAVVGGEADADLQHVRAPAAPMGTVTCGPAPSWAMELSVVTWRSMRPAVRATGMRTVSLP